MRWFGRDRDAEWIRLPLPLLVEVLHGFIHARKRRERFALLFGLFPHEEELRHLLSRINKPLGRHRRVSNARRARWDGSQAGIIRDIDVGRTAS